MKTRMLFINPCLRPGAARKFAPVGLGCILTALRRAGYDFDLIDMDADDLDVAAVAERIKGKTYDLCGFGCIVTGLGLVQDLARVVREGSPDCLIVAGNSVATSIPELLLRNTCVDVAVLGEGDVTIVELAKALCAGSTWKSVPGIAYLEGGRLVKTARRPVIADLDSLGFPDWSIFEIEKYNLGMTQLTVVDDERQVVFPLNGARGCPYDCTFCYHVFKGEKYRKYSDRMIRDEFVRLTQEFKATFIYFWDELSFPNVPSVTRLVEKLEELPFRTSWQGVSRADLFTAKDTGIVKRMHETGCRSLGFSIENASPEILRAMNKKITHANTVQHASVLWGNGITPLTSIIFGYPQETPETIAATLDLCEQCNIYPSVGFLQPLPGTPVYQWALEGGHIRDELEYLLAAGDRQDLHVNLTAMPSDELMACVIEGLEKLSRKMGLEFKNPLKTGVYQKPKCAPGGDAGRKD